jgi:thiosulfate dehydrogenase [quinone] large subunit
MEALRRLAIPIGIGAAVLLAWLVNPWFPVPESLRPVVTVLFWLTFLGLLVVLFGDRRNPSSDEVEVEGPAFTRFLFHNSRAGLFWLPIRLLVGFAWLDAGWHKLTDANGAWVGATAGSALRSYWERAVSLPEAPARPPITFEWYRDFIQALLDTNADGWMTWLITFGELAVGIALLVGALTGIAAFFGALMNMSFLLAGSASTNPVLFTLAVGLILAWRVAGWYGLDRYLLPMLGTPWRRGRLGVGATQPDP